jgi:hypothetical protein
MSCDDSRMVCVADKASRTITFHVRDGFGDGTDGRGLSLASETAERESALRIFGAALDAISGKKSSSLPVERWAVIAPIQAKAA